ncbi:hypothetical protein PRUPE_4G045600 [Prunus persica]|uniref:Uncharacterized protein n=1 Tax=Prunus persica TaxID=3760 RepID=A0A251PH86_PRUPE|nr:hypothetical protein PRUPE_4G045600 [Prunus persica]
MHGIYDKNDFEKHYSLLCFYSKLRLNLHSLPFQREDLNRKITSIRIASKTIIPIAFRALKRPVFTLLPTY